MVADNIFTEDMIKTAKEMEAAAASELARYYRSTMVRSEKVKMEDLEGLPDSELHRIMSKLAKEVENQRKNVKILNDIRNGKYRILFLALARHTERTREEINMALGAGTIDGIHNLAEMIAGLIDATDETETEEEEDKNNE